jgi:hypothetical protein
MRIIVLAAIAAAAFAAGFATSESLHAPIVTSADARHAQRMARAFIAERVHDYQACKAGKTKRCPH